MTGVRVRVGCAPVWSFSLCDVFVVPHTIPSYPSYLSLSVTSHLLSVFLIAQNTYPSLTLRRAGALADRTDD